MPDVDLLVRGVASSANTSTNLTVTSEPSTAVGDYLLVVALVDWRGANQLTINATTGVAAWGEPVASASSGTIYQIKAWLARVTTAGARSVTCSQGAGGASGFHVHVYTLNPSGGTVTLDSTPATGTVSASPATHPALSPAGSKDLLIATAGAVQYSSAFVFGAAPSGMTQGAAASTGGFSGAQSCYQRLTSSGSTGTRAQTWTPSSVAGGARLMFALRAEGEETGPVAKSAADSGVRTENATTSARATVAEARQGADSAATGSSFAATDSAQFTEGVAAGQLTDGPDAGTATDAVTGLAGTLAAADPRQGTDTLATSGSFTALDSGTVPDESTTITLPVPETGTRIEAVSSRGSFTAADPRTGADAATVETLYGDLVISIWAVDPDTGQLTALPDFTKLTMSPERNGPGSISLEYPRDGLNFHVLRDTITADRDLEVEIWNFGNNRGALRGYLQESSGDDIAEDQTAWTFAGGFLELRMAEAIVWPQPIVGEITLGENVDVPYGSVTQAQWDRLLSLGYTGTAGDNEEKITGVPQKVLDAVKANATSIPVLADPKRELKFEAVTVGELVNFILTQARSRGGLLDIATSFTNAADSNGVTWPTSVTTKYSPGASYESILNSLASQGRVEWSLTWDGTRRVLNLYVPSGRGVDRTIGLRPVVLRAGRNLAEAPRKWSVRSTATAMLGIGAEGFYADASNLDAQTRRGRRIEDSTSSQNLATADAVLAYAQRRLSTKKDGTLEVTHGLAMLPGEPRPLIAFDIGDWVYSQTATSLDRYRVVQWTLTVDAGQQASATVTLNDAFLDAVSRQQKELDALTSGETVVGTSQPGEDTGVPAAPGGLVVGSAAFIQGTDVYSAVQAGWSPVTVNTDGSAATDLDSYRVEWSTHTNPEQWMLGAEVDAQRTQASFTVSPGLLISVRVRARDRAGNNSSWSNPVDHLTEDDATPPSVASAPVGSNWLGSLRWTWDGRTADGADMLAVIPDFSHVELWMGASANFDDATLITQLYAEGTWTIAGLPYEVTQYGWLVAVDRRGNRAAPSSAGSSTPRKLVEIDFGPDAVDRSAIKELAVGTLQLDNGAVNSLKVSELSVGLLTGGVMSADVVIGGNFMTATTGRRVRIGNDGIQLYNQNDEAVVAFRTADASALVTGQYQTAMAGERLVLNWGGSNPSELRFYPSQTNQYGTIKVGFSTAGNYAYQAGLSMQAYSGRQDAASGTVRLFPDYADIRFGNWSMVQCHQHQIGFNAPRMHFGVRRNTGTGDDAIMRFGVEDPNDPGSYAEATVLSITAPSGGYAKLQNVYANSGISFNSLHIAAVHNDNQVCDIVCKTLRYQGLSPPVSARAQKTNIIDIEFDPIDAVRNAPALQWEYRADQDLEAPAPTHFGPMADDLPAQLQERNEDGDLTIDLANNMGVLWAAVGRLADRIDELTEERSAR